jgi:hypothetical protein
MSSETINQARRAIDFAQIPDGTQETLSPAELLKAAIQFTDLVNNTLFSHAGDVVTIQPGLVSKTDSGSSRISLKVSQEDGSRVTISVRTEANSMEIDSGSKIGIEVQETSPDGYGHKFHRYHMDTGDDEVRRFDRADTYKTISQSPHEIVDFSKRPSETVSVIKKQRSDLDNEIKNQELERQMGLNDQPVGSEEIAKLRALIEAAELRKQ